jgi:hypothetical protein
MPLVEITSQKGQNFNRKQLSVTKNQSLMDIPRGQQLGSEAPMDAIVVCRNNPIRLSHEELERRRLRRQITEAEEILENLRVLHTVQPHGPLIFQAKIDSGPWCPAYQHWNRQSRRSNPGDWPSDSSLIPIPVTIISF